jgi:hypothetical protein
MSGSSHSSKNTRPRCERRGRRADFFEAGLELVGERFGFALTSHESAEHPDHLQDLGDAALVERDDIQAAADELRGQIGLEVGEGEDEIRLQRGDLVELRVDERRHLRFLACLRRPHRISGDADDAIALAEKVESLGRFFRQTNDAARVPGHRRRRIHPVRRFHLT